MIDNNSKECNQNYWQLASIQIASIGINGIISSKVIAERYEPGTVISSVLLGNLFLWVVALSIVSMTAQTKYNAIENARAYIGRYGAILAALISITVFPDWFVIQMQATTNYVTNSFYNDGSQSEFVVTIYGIILGILISCIAMGRLIQHIKRISVMLLPVLIFFYLCFISLSSDLVSIPRKFEISIPCIVSYLTFSFAGIVNLPTFFRHTRSRYDSYLALTVMTVIISFFQIASIWIPHDIFNGDFFRNQTANAFFISGAFKTLTISFCIIILLCSNLVNIYFAKPSFELFFPRAKQSLLCLIIGLTGTSLYASIQFFFKNSTMMRSLENNADNCVANLGAVLACIFFIRLIIKHRPKPFEKLIGGTAWIIGCTTTVLATIQHFTIPPLLAGIGTTIVFFLVVLFIEEPFWSMTKLRIMLKKKTKKP